MNKSGLWQFLRRTSLIQTCVGVGVLVCLLPSCALLEKLPGRVPTTVHLTLGNPSNATIDSNNADNYLMIKPQYALAYNSSRRIPNWVSWQLNSTWLGNVDRSNNFRPDATLPQSWYKVVPTDYTGSGYDRGHMTPSGDRTNTAGDNSATFLMTNILPQAKDNNQGPWADLEVDCRELVKAGKTLYIVAGGYGKKQILVRGGITVPSAVWKVIVVLDQSGTSVQNITTATRVIAVNLPNVNGIKGSNWRQYRVSVDQIEQLTNYDLLSNVPVSTQQAIESRVDQQ